MNNRLQRRLTYLRDRMVNAYWMVRQGRFRLVYQSFLQELQTRRDQVESRLLPDDRPIQHTGGSNPCKPPQPSPRPTMIVAPDASLSPDRSLDAVAASLQVLLTAQPEIATDSPERSR